MKSLATVFILLSLVFVSYATPFPRATVINLPQHASRREHMAKELASHDFQYSWMDAVNGINLTQTELAKNATALARWFITPGMIGCFLSHRRCWEYCARSGEPLLVFEDDVVLAPHFSQVVMAAMDRLKTGDELNEAAPGCEFEWDVLLLGAMGCVHPVKRKCGFNWIPCLVGGKWRKTYRVANLDYSGSDKTTLSSTSSTSFLHVPMCPYGMHAYILSPQGAAKLLKLCPRASYHVDVVAWGMKELKILAVHPLVAWQTNHDTTIGGLVHVWKKFRILPTWVADKYTGFELGWALSAPLLRLGGPTLGGRLLLTNGNSLLFMFVGLIVAIYTRSQVLLGATLLYVLTVASLVRLLASKWNS